MYQVYVERNYSELSRNLLGEYSSLEDARAAAKKDPVLALRSE